MRPLAEVFKYQHATTLKFLMPSNLPNTEDNQAKLQEEAEGFLTAALDLNLLPGISIANTELMEDVVKSAYETMSIDHAQTSNF